MGFYNILAETLTIKVLSNRQFIGFWMTLSNLFYVFFRFPIFIFNI